jgi:hypothetical protein
MIAAIAFPRRARHPLREKPQRRLIAYSALEEMRLLRRQFVG